MNKNMRWMLIALVLVVAAAVCIFQPWHFVKKIVQADPVYTSSVYKVSFPYPSDWRQMNGYKNDRYEGKDGFFEVSAAENQTDLTSVVNGETGHILSPYGTTPTVSYIKVQGEQAALIMPSSDQDASMRHQAALVVPYPQPIVIGGQTYYYLVLWADKDHIRNFARSLTFLSSTQ